MIFLTKLACFCQIGDILGHMIKFGQISIKFETFLTKMFDEHWENFEKCISPFNDGQGFLKIKISKTFF